MLIEKNRGKLTKDTCMQFSSSLFIVIFVLMTSFVASTVKAADKGARQLLRVIVSQNKETSNSRKILNEFTLAFQSKHADWIVIDRDISHAGHPIPHISGWYSNSLALLL